MVCSKACVCACFFPLQGGREQLIKVPVTKTDMGTQTDTHFVESNIVKSYEWNEWELRRKAIKLVGGWGFPLIM